MFSLRTKFLIVVGVFAILFAAFGVLRTWSSVRAHAYELSAVQAELALQFDVAIRQYVSEKVRPVVEECLGPEEFVPEAMSTSFVARSVFDRVRRQFPDHVLKFSSDNPRNAANAAGPEELEILRYFRAHPEAEKWSGPMEWGGKQYLVHCVPRRLETSCLHCHGRPQDAPASLLARYGDAAGFHRSVGDVIALDTVGIPLDKIDAAMRSEARSQAGLLAIGVLCLGGVFILVFHFLAGHRLATIAQHFQRAAAHSNEAMLAPIAVRGRDEIGLLAANYNALASRARELHDSLEQRVEARTAALEQEVAERTRAEDALRKSERTLVTVLGNMPGMAYRCCNDAVWTMQFVSGGCRELTGYQSSELTGNRVVAYGDLIHPEDRDHVWTSVQWALVHHARFTLEYRIRSADGSEKWVWEQGVGVRSDDGQCTFIEGFISDVTERRLAEDNCRLAKEAAEAASRAKGEFLANMSHEIRTPMTAILGYIDLLADGAATGGTACSLEGPDPIPIIRRNADHLLRIIDNILDLSKIEAGQLALEETACSPQAILAEVAGLMRARSSAKGLTLSVEHEGPLPEIIHSDPTRIRQILVNLIGNAVKFTEVGGIRIVAGLDPSAPLPRLLIRVIDTGVGMSGELLGRLFQPFSQADTSTSRRFGGTGLGLSISKRLARLLGGDLTVSSCPGQGSTFTLVVPTGSLEGVRLQDELPAEAPPSPTPNQVATLPGRPRLLLVEDGPDNQRLIAMLLRKAGAAVEVAENGQVALDRLVAAQQAAPFDLVLIDIQMPVMDGYAATRALRDAGFRIPIVALTAHALSEDRQRCLDAGCDDYLTKPIDRHRLVEVIARHLAQSRVDPPSRTMPAAR